MGNTTRRLGWLHRALPSASRGGLEQEGAPKEEAELMIAQHRSLIAKYSVLLVAWQPPFPLKYQPSFNTK